MKMRVMNLCLFIAKTLQCIRQTLLFSPILSLGWMLLLHLSFSQDIHEPKQTCWTTATGLAD